MKMMLACQRNIQKKGKISDRENDRLRNETERKVGRAGTDRQTDRERERKRKKRCRQIEIDREGETESEKERLLEKEIMADTERKK